MILLRGYNTSMDWSLSAFLCSTVKISIIFELPKTKYKITNIINNSQIKHIWIEKIIIATTSSITLLHKGTIEMI